MGYVAPLSQHPTPSHETMKFNHKLADYRLSEGTGELSIEGTIPVLDSEKNFIVCKEKEYFMDAPNHIDGGRIGRVRVSMCSVFLDRGVYSLCLENTETQWWDVCKRLPPGNHDSRLIVPELKPI